MGRNILWRHSPPFLPPLTESTLDFNDAAKIKWDEIMKCERVKHGNSAKYFCIYLPQSFNLQHSPSKLPSNFEQNIK